MRRVLGIVLVAAVTGACAAGDPYAKRATPPKEVVFLDDGVELTAMEPSTGTTPFRIGGRWVPTPDWRYVARALDGPDETVLDVVDTATGSGADARYLEAGLEPRAATNDGTVVLMPRRAQPNDYTPEGRTETALVIARRGAADPQRIRLSGNYEPEAFSTDGQTLFVIEYRPPTHPEVYSVRQLDLATGIVTPVPSRDKELQEDMRGTARTHAMAPDGSRLYTLYNLEMPHPDGTIHRHAFVHVLDLREKWAHCVDLPASFVTSSETASAIAVSSERDRVYVVNRKAGEVAEVDTLDVSLRRTVPLRLAPDESLAVTTSAHGLFVGTGQRVVALDSALHPVGEWRLERMVVGLQPSGDGRHLYVSTRDQLLTLDLRGGQVRRTQAASGSLLARGMVPSTVLDPGIPCAC
jgi:hypothetical protein